MMAPSGLFFVRRLGAVLAALPLMAGSALAMDTVYVHPAGDADGAGTEVDPVADIETAMGLVNPGGVVTLSAGVYPIASTIVITTPVMILGPQANVDPRPFSDLGPESAPSSRTLDDPSTEAIIDGQGGLPFRIQSSDVTISGLSFRNSEVAVAVSPPGGDAKGFDPPNVLNVRLSFNGVEGPESGPSFGFDLLAVGETEVSYNYFGGLSGYAVAMNDRVTTSTIRYNEVAGNSSEAPSLTIADFSLDVVDFNSSIVGNWIYGHQGYAIQGGTVSGGLIAAKLPVPLAGLDEGLVIADNVVGVDPTGLKGFSGTPGRGIRINVNDAIVRNNRVVNARAQNDEDGGIVVAAGAEDIFILNNRLEGIVFSSIASGGALNLLGETNGVSKSIAPAIVSVTVLNNVFEGNTPAIVSRVGARGSLLVRHNDFIENIPSVALLAGQQIILTENRFRLSEDDKVELAGEPTAPRLVHVQAYSPSASYTFDFVGNEVHSGTVFTDSSNDLVAKGNPVPIVTKDVFLRGNWYAIAFDPDFDANGVIDGLEVPQSLPDSDVPTTETQVVAQLDRDADGATDAAEIFGLLGTSFTNPDSNSDGLPDGVIADPTVPSTPTLLLEGNAPLLANFVIDADTDGDTFPDWYEVARFTDPSDPDDFPPLGDIAENDSVDLADAVLALQLLNGSEPLTLATSDNITALSVAPDGLLSLNNPLQILRYSALIRAGLPALPGID